MKWFRRKKKKKRENYDDVVYGEKKIQIAITSAQMLSKWLIDFAVAWRCVCVSVCVLCFRACEVKKKQKQRARESNRKKKKNSCENCRENQSENLILHENPTVATVKSLDCVDAHVAQVTHRHHRINR